MAIMIPENYRESSPYSEKRVFDVLREKLSDAWTVFYSFSYVGYNEKDNTNYDGEADFVLYNPEYGMLVLEVKGGIISYIHNQWMQNGTYSIDPFKQALKNKVTIMNLFQDKLDLSQLPMKVAHAVCFPDSVLPDPSVQTWPAEAEGIVLAGGDLRFIEQFAIRVIEKTPVNAGFGKGIDRKTVLDIMSPCVQCKAVDEYSFENDEQKIYQLTKQQTFVLNALQNFKRLIFRGCAGSGKTVMAVKKAKMLADQGKTVLLLCYNEMLAKFLKREVEGYAGYITVKMFFEFCIRELGLSEERIRPYRNNDKFYNDALPTCMKTAIVEKNLYYDAVIVDEGQDFAPSVWEAIAMMPRANGEFYIFYDPEQNLYDHEIKLPDFGVPEVVLNMNCRNTKNIFQEISKHCSTKCKILDGAPIGRDVRVLKGDCRENLTRELERVLLKENICITDVVVLGAHNLNHTSLGDDPKVGRFTLVEGNINISHSEVAYHTYMKFKGCDAKVVILYDVDPQDERWNRAGLYTAMSRAIHELIILEK